jgi:hypothetical protein
MQRITLLIVAGFSAVLIAVATASLTSPHQPTYQGRSMSQHLSDIDASGPARDKAENAFARLGTNAVPFLRRALQARDNPPKRVLLWALRKQSLVKLPLRPAVQTQRLALVAYGNLIRSVRSGSADLALADACTEEITALAIHADEHTSLLANDILRRAAAAKLEAATRAPTSLAAANHGPQQDK